MRCKNHKLIEFELKNGNILKVCFTCGLDLECDKETRMPLHIFNAYTEKQKAEIKKLLKV